MAGSTTTVFVYDAGGLLVAEYTNETPQSGGTSYFTDDHLGSNRLVTDASGAVTARHDYLPFGEELCSGTGGRSADYKCAGDTVRQKFTGKERDSETGLDYFLARYYSAKQGRFTSPDEFAGGPDEFYDFGVEASQNPTFYAELTNPQTLNKYQYCFNNPLQYVDPDGHQTVNEAMIVVTPRTSQRILNIGAGVVKSIVNIGIGLNNLNAEFGVGDAEYVEPYQPSNTVQEGAMGITDKATLLVGLLGGKSPAGVVAAESRTTAQVVAQVGNASAKSVGPVTGYTKHGLNQAIGRNGGRGVNAKAIVGATKAKPVVQSSGTAKLKGSRATVVLNKEGKVITTFGKSRGPQIRPEGTKRPSGSGSAQRKANKRGFSYYPRAVR